jgi:hypothetical protein
MGKGPTYAQLAEKRKWAAFHEAGHVVRAVAWQIPVRTVSLLSHPTVDPELGKFLLGTSTYRPPPGPDLTPLEVCIGLTICAAGEAAERRYRRGTRKRLRAREEADIVHAARGDRRNIQAHPPGTSRAGNVVADHVTGSRATRPVDEPYAETN